ncbi:MAG: hypothetical protein RI883_2559 [Bacteroidota bacterium]|jgi:hypothetical protein
MRKISEIKNFGPKMVTWLNKIEIYTEEDLLQSDYLILKNKFIAGGIQPHILMFYSIDMGLQDRIWSDITPVEKLELKLLLEEK